MSSKRKSRGSEAALETPDTKRQKSIEEETAEGTYVQGIALLSHLKNARDKRNHVIATNFETLPDEGENPDYYDLIKLPLALDTVEGKLERREYPTMTTLESDFKRLVANAKAYNDKASDVVADAEKIRKLVSNFMVKKNPAYRDPQYSAFATPIPGEDKEQGQTPGRKRTKVPNQDDTPVKAKEPTPEPPRDTRRVLKIRAPRRSRAREESPAPAEENAEEDDTAEKESEKEEPAEEDAAAPADAEEDGEDEEEDEEDEDAEEDEAADESAEESFEGKTFQQAQQKMVTELMEYTNDEGVEISGPFLNLPPRTLKDYYQAIKYPVSLKAVQKRIRGQRGRDKPTGVSHFKSWQALADEVSFVWINARTYNEDGSEIFEAANQLEAYFKKRLEDAKAAVPEPSQPKVTLRVSSKEVEPTTKIKLHLSSRPAASQSEVAVDQDALKRQQDLVAAGSAGQARPSTSGSAPRAPSEAVQPDTKEPQPNGVKPEAHSSQSPAAVRQGSAVPEAFPAQNGSMPPAANHASASPMPQKPAPPAPKDPYELRTRPEGKGLDDALFTSFIVATHPSLRTQHTAVRYEFAPSATLTQQIACIHLEPTHTLFRVAVVLPLALAQRPHKAVLKLNRQLLHPLAGQLLEGADPRAAVYEISLIPGMVNALELEVLGSQATRGNPKHGAASEYEYERFSVFANVFAA